MKSNVCRPQQGFLLNLTAAVFVLVFLANTVAAQDGIIAGRELADETNVGKPANYARLRSIIVTGSKHFNTEPRDSNAAFKRVNLDTINTRRFFSSVKRADDSYKLLEEKDDDALPPVDERFRWGSAIRQSLLFLSVQHGYALTQPKTREALKGKFVKDYAASVKSLHGWNDGGRFFTNYIAHPLQGSFMGFIQIQNDPRGMKQRFGPSAGYWKSRMKAMAWSAAWSTQFEIGPLSQASIGNVGLKGKQTWIDIVVTPTVGTAFLIAEDAMDRFVVERIERMSDNYYLMIFARTLLNPTRTMANIIRFKLPWYRDRKRLH